MKTNIQNKTNSPLHIRPGDTALAPGDKVDVTGTGASTSIEPVEGSVKVLITNDADPPSNLTVRISSGPTKILQPNDTFEYETPNGVAKLDIDATQEQVPPEAVQIPAITTTPAPTTTPTPTTTPAP